MSTTFELPGVNKDSVSVDVLNNLLTVSSETKSEAESNGNGYLSRERRFGRFPRTSPVPEVVKVCRLRLCAHLPAYRLTSGCQPEEIKASMENSVLTVTYPRQILEHISKKIASS